MQIKIPYGKKFLLADIPEKNLLDIITPKELIPPDSAENILADALKNPLGSERLSDFVKKEDSVVIVVDDYTRPCPNELMLKPVLEELKMAGVSDSNILLIIATGTHTPPDFEKIKEIVGDKIARNYNVISNDVENSEYVSIGKSKFGNEIEIIKEYLEADVKIILGDIVYHYFAGYGGTRKSILPGIASRNTIQNNHSMLFENQSTTGKLKGNRISEEMLEAMHKAGCDFCLNVVLNSNKQIIGAWSGNPDLVMNEGVKLIDSLYKREVLKQSDIVIVGANGYPSDINLYQSMKALHLATKVTKKGGIIIFIAECINGIGSNLYLEWLKKYKTSSEIQNELSKKFIIGAHKAYYHRKAVENYDIFLISSLDTSCYLDTFSFSCVANINDALIKAFNKLGTDAKIIVIPQGTVTFSILKK